MKKEANPNSEFIRDAYRVVAEGLKSMQRLQSQTAEAHQKFLETQAEANRTRNVILRSPRGIIVDRHGQLMVDSRPSYDAVVLREEMDDEDRALTLMSQILRFESEEESEGDA